MAMKIHKPMGKHYYTMTQEQAIKTFGPKIWENDFCIVRIMTEGRETIVSIHYKKKNGNEELPQGYVLGENMAIFKEPTNENS